MKGITKSTASDVAHIGFTHLLAKNRLALPITEYRFHPEREWRFDYSWPERKVALEVDGGIFKQGRHTRGKGWLADTEKLNAAATLGWRMLRCTPTTLCSHEMIETVKSALKFELDADFTERRPQK